MAMPDFDEQKARQRATWSAGNYDGLAQLVASIGETVVEAAAIEPGMTVLDVATGAGNAAIPAARAGARVTGLDLTPELLDHARRHAAEAEVEIEWVEGDAEALPFQDASFDRVLSTIGVMFAPQQKLAAAELARVCKPGGSVVLASWTPQGFQGRIFGVIAKHMPPSSGVPSPLLWGDERHVRTLLGGQLLLAQERRWVDFRPPSADAMIAMFDHAFGPFIMARRALGDEAFGAVLSDARALAQEFDEGEDAPHIRAEYLLTIAHRP
jgi:ubiquinone/menaquinone biosynthesis C-methylase UbiE